MDLHLSVVRRTTQHIGTEISYIIDIPKINGKFCPQKAKALGIPSVGIFCYLSSRDLFMESLPLVIVLL